MYQPAEDSFLLAKQLNILLSKLNSNIKILDMGTGSGIQAKECLKSGINKKNLTLVDIDKQVIRNLEKKFNIIHSNLFSKVKGKFDLIIFNPPYLPEDKYDNNLDTTGGKKGDETTVKFLKQSKYHLNKNGKILLLLSSLTPRKRIQEEIKKQKKKLIKLDEEKLFMESLEIFLIQ